MHTISGVDPEFRKRYLDIGAAVGLAATARAGRASAGSAAATRTT